MWWTDKQQYFIGTGERTINDVLYVLNGLSMMFCMCWTDNQHKFVFDKRTINTVFLTDNPVVGGEWTKYIALYIKANI